MTVLELNFKIYIFFYPKYVPFCPSPLKKKYIYIYIFINLFLAMLGLHCCMGFSFIAVSRSYSLVVVHRLLIAMASPVDYALGHTGFNSGGAQAH